MLDLVTGQAALIKPKHKKVIYRIWTDRFTSATATDPNTENPWLTTLNPDSSYLLSHPVRSLTGKKSWLLGPAIAADGEAH